MQVIDRIALILTIVGGLNWGSIGLFRFDLVAWICGARDLHARGSGRGLVHFPALSRPRRARRRGGHVMPPAAKNGMADAMPFFSPTRTAALGSHWEKAQLAAAHALHAVSAQCPRLRAERYFLRRTRRRRK